MSALNEPGGVCPHCGFDNAFAQNEPHQLECGSILAGAYLVGRALGQGGFGITYVGWDINLDLKVAIKEYYPEGCVTRDAHTHLTVATLSGDRAAIFHNGKARFVSEAKTLAKFSGDSGVVGVRNYFAENGTAYIVMDFVEGETLKAYAQRRGGKIPTDEVLAMMRPLIESLKRVHAEGLLHRDISPDNIMLQPNGVLKLLDFGAARQFSTEGEHSNTINVKHGFAPEEQYRTRGEQGPWTDVYALCATIYRLTTGVTPMQALDRMYGDERIPSPNSYGAQFSKAEEAALEHGLAVHAASRTQNMQQLAQELYGDASGKGDAHEPVIVQTPPVARQKPQDAPHDAKQATGATTSVLGSVTAFGGVVKERVEGAAEKLAGGDEKRGMRKLIAIAAAALVVVALVVSLIAGKANYNRAMREMEDFNFNEANIAFCRIPLCWVFFPKENEYFTAAEHVAMGRYDEGISAFEQLGDYRNSAEAAKQARYLQAGDLTESGKFEQAQKAYDSLGSYRDAKEKSLDARYEQACALLEQDLFSDAISELESLSKQGYAPATKKLKAAYYDKAKSDAARGDYALAYSEMKNAGDYSDAKSLAKTYHDAALDKAIDLYRSGSYSAAQTALERLDQDDTGVLVYQFLSIVHQDWSSYGTASEVVDILIDLIDFEDANDLLLLDDKIAGAFIQSKWYGGSYYIFINTDGYMRYNIPTIDYGSYYVVQEGYVLFYNDGDFANAKKAFKMTVIDKNNIEVYSYKTKQIYKLHRPD